MNADRAPDEESPGGESVCYAHLTCPECGRLADTARPEVCAECGAEFPD